jgi:putative tricarboxylic transport membrane protein
MVRAAALVFMLVIAEVARAATSLTLIAPAAPGGGWDQTARVMQRVLAEIEPGVSVQVDNVPGAAGTIGLARFIQSERGNPDALLVMGLVMVSGAITNHSPVTPGDATPIARLTGEFEVIVVPAGSPYRSMRELVDAFRSDPGSIAWGGGSAGGTDDLLIRLMAEQAGLAASRVNYIAFAGGGAALAAVLGGQVTAGVSGYAEFAGQIEAGQLRVLAVSSPTRVANIDAPTLREEGVALDLANWRAVLAPPGLSDVERDALVARVTRLAGSEAWKKALEQNGWEDLFLSGPDFRQFLLSEQARVGAVLERLAATDTTQPSALALTVTPMTLPGMVASMFAAVALLFILKTRRRWSKAGLHAPGTTLALGVALLIQPVLFPAAGFVIASMLLFAATASALRGERPQWAGVLRDLAIGGAVSGLLYLAFSRGLGVHLPPVPFG